jgi:hypothetical protein
MILIADFIMHTGKKNWYIHKYKARGYVMSMLKCYINSMPFAVE